jgi:flavin-dependent dehydrogenase
LPGTNPTSGPSDRLIRIAGAGPSGLAAAITLARAGRQTVVHERRAEAGARFHGDFQGIENYSTAGDAIEELAAAGIPLDCDVHPFRSAVICDATGREFRYGSSSPLFYMVRRGVAAGTLDQGLKAAALGLGVEIRFHSSLASETPGIGIRATGPRGSFAIVVGYLFATSLPDMVLGVLSDRLAPAGYAYLVVCDGRATLASTIFADQSAWQTYLDRTVAFYNERTAGAISLDGAAFFGGSGNVRLPRSARANAGATLIAGEAAGFQDALWGFGLRSAMLSGHLAARALVAGRPAAYDSSWRARLGGQMRTSFVNRFFYARLGDRGYSLFLRRLGAAGDAREWLRGHYAPSIWKDLWYLFVSRLARMASPGRLPIL